MRSASIRFRACTLVRGVDTRYFRPTEVETLLGDATKAHQKLGWRAARSASRSWCREMVKEDLDEAQRDAMIAKEGYKVYNHHE